MADDTAIFMAVLISLLCSSFCVAWIANDYAQAPVCVFGTQCAPIEIGLQTVPYNESVSTQDYRNTTTYDPALTKSPYTVGATFGSWTQGAGGFTLTDAAPAVIGKDPSIYLENVIATNGVYSVDYVIDNANGGEFYIAPRMGDFPSVYFILPFDYAIRPITIPIMFSSTGIRIPGHDLILWDVYTQTIPDVQTTLPGGSLFTVIYDEPNKGITVIKDGTTLMEETGLELPDMVTVSQDVHFGGVASNTPGFSLVSTTATRSTISQAAVSVQNYIDDLVNVVTGTIPGLSQVLQLLTIIGQVVLWTLPEQIFPLWLNMILIKPQVIILLYIGAKLARGGG
jgi:hypothetical protein